MAEVVVLLVGSAEEAAAPSPLTEVVLQDAVVEREVDIWEDPEMLAGEVGSLAVDCEDTDPGPTSVKTDVQEADPLLRLAAVSTKEEDRSGIVVAKDTLDRTVVDPGTMVVEARSLTKKTLPFRTLRLVARKKRTDGL